MVKIGGIFAKDVSTMITVPLIIIIIVRVLALHLCIEKNTAHNSVVQKY